MKYEIPIRKGDGVIFDEIYARKARIERKKAKLMYFRVKLAFISIVSILIFVGLIITPKTQTNASESMVFSQNLEKPVKITYNDEFLIEKAFQTITKFEGYHDKPYWDYKQWSCGYGMRCSKNTTGITKEKSKWFVVERIKSIREKYNLYKYEDNLEVAIISFTYNLGHPPSGMDWYIRNGYTNGLKNRMREYVYAGNTKLGGLVKRRNYETSLF